MPGVRKRGKLGDLVNLLGNGSAKRAGKALADNKVKKKKRLDDIMGEIRKTRGK